MRLIIDVGNTHTVLGIYDSKSLIEQRSIETRAGVTSDELWGQLKLVLNVELDKSISVIVASVVPELTSVIKALVNEYLSTEPCFLQHPWPSSAVDVDLENPKSVGADRVAGATGFYKQYGSGIIVDFGTATTFDAVNKNGEYVGGLIFPGLHASAVGLSTETAKLPLLSPEKPERFSCSNTEQAVQSGLYYGTVGAIEHLVKLLRRNFNVPNSCEVVATGGGAEDFLNMTEIITVVDHDLVLDGLNQIF